jgi:ATP-dependent helicase HrpA
MNFNPLNEQIFNHCALDDRKSLLAKLRKLRAQKGEEKLLSELQKAIGKSIERVELRQKNRPQVALNKALPFYDKRDELKQVISDNQVVIVCGETGSGKTTQ